MRRKAEMVELAQAKTRNERGQRAKAWADSVAGTALT